MGRLQVRRPQSPVTPVCKIGPGVVEFLHLCFNWLFKTRQFHKWPQIGFAIIGELYVKL